MNFRQLTPRLHAYRWFRAFMLGLRSGDGKLNKPSATLILAFVYPPVRKWYEAGRRLGKHPNN